MHQTAVIVISWSKFTCLKISVPINRADLLMKTQGRMSPDIVRSVSNHRVIYCDFLRKVFQEMHLGWRS